jgi:hypothetical protein
MLSGMLDSMPDGGDRFQSSFGWCDVCKNEAIPHDDFPEFDFHRMLEHRPREDETVKLAIFPAGVHVCGKRGQ